MNDLTSIGRLTSYPGATGCTEWSFIPNETAFRIPIDDEDCREVQVFITPHISAAEELRLLVNDAIHGSPDDMRIALLRMRTILREVP